MERDLPLKKGILVLPFFTTAAIVESRGSLPHTVSALSLPSCFEFPLSFEISSILKAAAGAGLPCGSSIAATLAIDFGMAAGSAVYESRLRLSTWYEGKFHRPPRLSICHRTKSLLLTKKISIRLGRSMPVMLTHRVVSSFHVLIGYLVVLSTRCSKPGLPLLIVGLSKSSGSTASVIGRHCDQTSRH